MYHTPWNASGTAFPDMHTCHSYTPPYTPLPKNSGATLLPAGRDAPSAVRSVEPLPTFTRKPCRPSHPADATYPVFAMRAEFMHAAIVYVLALAMAGRSSLRSTGVAAAKADLVVSRAAPAATKPLRTCAQAGHDKQVRRMPRYNPQACTLKHIIWLTARRDSTEARTTTVLALQQQEHTPSAAGDWLRNVNG